MKWLFEPAARSVTVTFLNHEIVSLILTDYTGGLELRWWSKEIGLVSTDFVSGLRF